MPCLTDNQLLQSLRETNSRLHFWLDRLVPDDTHPAPTPHLISELLSELLRAGECLRTQLPKERDAQVEVELATYRRNVERLRDHMPAIHRHLLQQKARLEADRKRIESAAEWARGSRQTL